MSIPITENTTGLQAILDAALALPDAGSGGAELNFEVVGGNDAPASPSENMIWVSNSNLLNIDGWLANISLATYGNTVTYGYEVNERSITITNSTLVDGDCVHTYDDNEYAQIPCTAGKTYTIEWEHTGNEGQVMYVMYRGGVKTAFPVPASNKKLEFVALDGNDCFWFEVGVNTSSSEETSATFSNIRIVEEATPITEWSFASKNPYVYYVDVDYLDGEATTAGYFSSTGTISAQSSTNKEVYVEKYIPVEYGKIYNYTYALPESKSMWLAIVEYTGEQVFSKRTVLVNSVTGTSQTGEYTPSTEVTSVRLTWRTFGLESSVEFVGSEERTDASAEGAVWISTGTNSPTAFNALKKNNVTVYPLSAEQCIDGVWRVMDAETYQNGVWVEWIPIGALYWHGNECTDITGGWTSKAWKMQSDAGTTAQTFEIARNSDHLMFTKTGDIGAVMYAEKSIDLTNVKTIHFKGEMSMASRANWVAFHVWTNMNGTYWATNSVASVNTSTSEAIQEFALDVSALTGNYFLGFGIYSAACYVKVEELLLEVAE